MRVNSTDHAALVADMARGDERAAARLYDEYSSIMYAIALRIVGENADAEEVVLEAFTQAWKGASAYQRARSSVLTWLTMMTRTRALDFVRARTRRARMISAATLVFVDEPLAISAAAQSIADSLEDAEQAIAVTRALETLAKPQRTAIELAFYRGLSHPEIALMLGEPLGTIKTRIRLGIHRMRHVLGHAGLLAGHMPRSPRLELAS